MPRNSLRAVCTLKPFAQAVRARREIYQRPERLRIQHQTAAPLITRTIKSNGVRLTTNARANCSEIGKLIGHPMA